MKAISHITSQACSYPSSSPVEEEVLQQVEVGGGGQRGRGEEEEQGEQGEHLGTLVSIADGGEGLTRQEGDMMVVKLQGRLPMIH